MNLDDVLVEPDRPKVKAWQLGHIISKDIAKGGVTLMFCSDERGYGGDAKMNDFSSIRSQLYQLSQHDLRIPIGDLGDIITGRTLEDTHCIIEELVLKCLEEDSIPVIIGSGKDMAYPMYKAVGKTNNTVNYTHIDAFIHLGNAEKPLSEKNVLSKILTSNEAQLKTYYHLGYQRHLNEKPSVELLNNIDAEALSLSAMMQHINNAEPFLRRSNLVTLSCDAIQSIGGSFSQNPQVNGLNSREACGLAKEIGMGQEFAALGIFNYNFSTDDDKQRALLSQMLWYLFEGISIQKSHPKEQQLERYVVLIDSKSLEFKREAFTNLWYFGESDSVNQCLPCTEQDYKNAKKGYLSKRLAKFLSR